MLKFIFLFLFSFNTYAFDEWTTSDTQREVVYMAVTTIDWAQTRSIARNPNIQEENSILGPHPTVGRVDGYFASMMLLHAGIAYILPEWARASGQYLTIGIETNMVIHNFSIGIGAKF